MSFINKILPNYTYYYFDDTNELKSKKLNIIECFFRKVFGCYAETHLPTVSQNAYQATLNYKFYATDKEKQVLLKLIAKARAVYGYSRSFIQLPKHWSSDNTKVNIRMHYNIIAPKKATDRFAISSIDFYLSCKSNKFVDSPRVVSIFRNRSHQLVARLPDGLFDEQTSLKMIPFKSDYKRTINGLLTNILNDSALATSNMDKIQYYGTDHRWVSHVYDSENSFKAHKDPATLNQTQDDEMKKLGWQYFRLFSESGTLAVQDIKRVYHLTKASAGTNNDFNKINFDQKLSLAFAEPLLQVQTREY